MRHHTHVTVKSAIGYIRGLGLTCNRTEHGEFRINLPDGNEDSAYYTDDATDAVMTAEHMHQFMLGKADQRDAVRASADPVEATNGN